MKRIYRATTSYHWTVTSEDVCWGIRKVKTLINQFFFFYIIRCFVMFGTAVWTLFSLYQKKAGLASRNIIHPRFLQRKGSTERYQSGVVSEGEKFSFQWCDCFHDILNRSPPVGLWRYKRNIICYVTEEITSLWLAEDSPISIASLGRLDYQPLFREMSPRSSKGGTRWRETERAAEINRAYILETGARY